MDVLYTYMKDLQNHLPWEDNIVYKDGQAYGVGPRRKE